MVNFRAPLRTDLIDWMLEWESKTDLCLALGTSLCNTTSTADRLVATVAKRAAHEPSVLGAVIVGLQQTRLDDLASLRFFARIDDVMLALAKVMDLNTRWTQWRPPHQHDEFTLEDGSILDLTV